MLLADETYRLDPAQSLLVSVDLPVDARVVEATPSRPYLAVRIALDPAVVGELLADGTTAPPLGPPARGLAVTPVEPPLLDAVARLVALLDGAASNAPVSATYTGEAHGVTYCVSGKLSLVTEDWIVIGGEGWEQWVPRETILLLDFRP